MQHRFDVFDEVFAERFFCRAFRPDPVPHGDIEKIVSLARRVPSWCNAQPWQFVITRGAETDAFRSALMHAVETTGHAPPDISFPEKCTGVYQDRRRTCGFQLYEAVGIARADRAGRTAQMMRNFTLFDTPHVGIITSATELGPHGALDCGGFVTAFTVAAQSLGVATIPQAVLASYAPFLRDYFDLGNDRIVLCAISFGYADPDDAANQFRTDGSGSTISSTGADERTRQRRSTCPDLRGQGGHRHDPRRRGHRPVPGGAALNSARAVARRGVHTAFSGAIGQNALGEVLMQDAISAGVDMRCCLRGPAETTLPPWPAAQAILLGGFSLFHPPATEVFAWRALALPTGVALYLDLNIRPAVIEDEPAYRARLDQLMRAATIIKVSDEDEDLDWLGATADRLAPSALVLHTWGAKGTIARIGMYKTHIPAPQTDVVDTVGAGDVFNAAWLAFGLRAGQLVPRERLRLDAALRYAVTTASLSTTRPGATGPNHEEITCAL